MPELPEVETIVRDLAPRVTGSRLRRPRLYRTDVLRGVTARRLLVAVRGARVTEVTRRAKHVVVRLASGHRLIIQPRMTGSLVIDDRRPAATERAYIVFEALLDDGGRLVFRDVRRLGTIWLLDERGWTSYTARIGPEPLAPGFTAAALRARIEGTTQAIKKVLMDQRRLAGVGNIYASEALFRAGIDPSRPAATLSPTEYRRLHRAVRHTLRAAIRHQGTTLRDYRTGTGERGSHQHALQVYGRGGEPCVRCAARLITTHAIDGRATTVCWRCQG